MAEIGRKLGAGALAIVGIAGFVAWYAAAIAQRQTPIGGDAQLLITADKVKYPTDYRQKLTEVIARAPLSQNHLNGLYGYEFIRRDPEDRALERIRKALAGQGWQSTPAQQNLLMVAAVRADVKTLVERADALLRRQRLEPESRELLYYFERQPDARGYLLTALGRHPIWRDFFLQDPRGMQTPDRLMARSLTIGAMQRRGMKLDRDELAPLLSRLVEGGRADRAYALWTAAEPPIKNVGGFIRDGNFAQAAARAGQEDLPAYPFDWKMNGGRGYGASISGAAGSSELQIRWDGRGVPVFAQQTLRVEPGHYILKLEGLDAKPTTLNFVGVSATCGNKVVPFEPVMELNREAGVTLRTADAIPCRFPDLRITGQPTESQRGIEASFSSISMRRG
jgi:hypothetical protein